MVDSDEHLLERWRSGDQAAGEALFERHFHMVHRFLKRKVTDGIEDLLQQVFLECVAARDRFRRDASFSTFLLGIARNQLYTYYRHKQKLDRLDFTVTSLQDLGASVTADLAHDDERRMLFEALHRLPLEQQIVIELAYWEEMKGPDIAVVVGVPVSSVYTRLRVARERLATELARLRKHFRRDTEPADFETWMREVAGQVRASERDCS